MAIVGCRMEFQSPDGDFVYSDEYMVGEGEDDLRKFQSPDGDFVYSDAVPNRPIRWGVLRFNPLTGISSILTFGPACGPWGWV